MDYIVALERWRNGPARRQLASRLPIWAETEGALVGIASPTDLFAVLGSPPSARRDEVFCALLRIAKAEQLAGEVVLSALLPGLKKLVGELLHDADARDQLWSSVLASLWELIVIYPVERRPRKVAANLLLDTRKRTLKDLAHLRTHARPPEACQAAAPAGVVGSVDLLIARAVAAGAVRRSEGRLILATRIDGRPLHRYARLGLSYRALVMRRWRAEKRLFLFLGMPGVTSENAERHIWSARTAEADSTR